MRVRTLGTAGLFEQPATPARELEIPGRGPLTYCRTLIHTQAGRLKTESAQPRRCSSSNGATTKHHELIREFNSARR